MEEKTLRNTALACSVAGLVLLFFTSNAMQIVVGISSITIDNTGMAFRICGNITSSRISNNHIFLDIRDSTGSIRFVMFNTTALKLNSTGISPYTLGKGMAICAPGIAQEYPKGSGMVELVYRNGDIEIA